MKKNLTARCLIHILLVAVLYLLGVFVFSYKLFPVALATSGPVSPLVGGSLMLVFGGVSALAGIGFDLCIDWFFKKKDVHEMSETKLLDFIAFSQYFTVALLSLFVHFSI